MVKALLIATTGDRLEMFRQCFTTAHQHTPKDYEIYVSAHSLDRQTETTISLMLQKSGRTVGLATSHGYGGPHESKVAAMAKFKHVNTWVSLDDDMEVRPETDYDVLIDFAHEEGVGLVSGNWARSEGLLHRAVLDGKKVKQAIVYTGGGLVVTRRCMNIIQQIPNRYYICDNTEWSLAVWLAGYENYRHRGSVAIHKVCSKGGRATFLHNIEGVPPDSKWVSYEMSKRAKYRHGINNLILPNDSGLTDKAIAQHERARRELLSQSRT